MDVKIFVCCHKKTPFKFNSVFTCVGLGGFHSPSFLTDNTGDNISDKNPFYSELTAHYWVWKNIQADFYGFFHYRRFLDFSSHKNIPVFHKFSPSLFKKYGWDTTTINHVCYNADVILPIKNKSKKHNPISLYDYYKREHHEKDLNITLDVLKEKYPDMAKTADDVINGTTGYFYNLFLMRKNYFQSYEKWLFDILFEVEKRINFSDYDSYQRRVFGFLGERLESIYIEHLKRTTSARILELPFIYWEENAKLYYKKKFKFYKRLFLQQIGF